MDENYLCAAASPCQPASGLPVSQHITQLWPLNKPAASSINIITASCFHGPGYLVTSASAGRLVQASTGLPPPLTEHAPALDSTQRRWNSLSQQSAHTLVQVSRRRTILAAHQQPYKKSQCVRHRRRMWWRTHGAVWVSHVWFGVQSSSGTTSTSVLVHPSLSEDRTHTVCHQHCSTVPLNRARHTYTCFRCRHFGSGNSAGCVPSSAVPVPSPCRLPLSSRETTVVNTHPAPSWSHFPGPVCFHPLPHPPALLRCVTPPASVLHHTNLCGQSQCPKACLGLFC